MLKIAEMLNKLESWCKKNRKDQYEPMKAGLTERQIDSILGDWKFHLPREIMELYQWGNGSIHYSFLPYPNGDYGIQEFYSLSNAIGESHDFNEHFSNIKNDEFLLLLFGAEGCYIWTVLKKDYTDLAPIYSNDEPVMYSPDYPSLAVMLENIIKDLKIN